MAIGNQGLPRTMVRVRPGQWNEGFLSRAGAIGGCRSAKWAMMGPASAFSLDATTCPGSLDCALKRRAKCPPGAHACGPCLQSFQEDQRGFCVPRKHQSSGEGLSQPRLEEEIDSLAQELALKEKEAGHSRLTAQPLLEASQKLLEPAATLGFSQWGQGPEPGLPSSHGTSSPTPYNSLSSRTSSGPVQMSPLEPQGSHGNGLTLGRSRLATKYRHVVGGRRRH